MLKIRNGLALVSAIGLWVGTCSTVNAQKGNNEFGYVNQKYDLSRDHSKEIHYFQMQSKMIRIAADGKRQDSTTFILHLRCDPAQKSGANDVYTCLQYIIKKTESDTISIPSLAGWNYSFTPDTSKSPTRNVLGIPHEPFEKLTDSKGSKLTAENSYFVYNTFIDFHSMNVFADKTYTGKGVQDLHEIGDKIVHASAFSEPPVNLGKDVAEGSFFKNGMITLEFKGISSIGKKPCALLGYDSGESSFIMLMNAMPNLQVKTIGSSHYWGDIYKGLQDGWIHKATLHEVVVSETEVPGQTQKFHFVIERKIDIMSGTDDRF